jgi:hypothetical protein
MAMMSQKYHFEATETDHGAGVLSVPLHVSEHWQSFCAISARFAEFNFSGPEIN